MYGHCNIQRIAVELGDGGDYADITAVDASLPRDMKKLLELEDGIIKAET